MSFFDEEESLALLFFFFFSGAPANPASHPLAEVTQPSPEGIAGQIK